jgi:hypothetical protein
MIFQSGRLRLSAESTNHSTLFFSHNKLVNNTFRLSLYKLFYLFILLMVVWFEKRLLQSIMDDSMKFGWRTYCSTLSSSRAREKRVRCDHSIQLSNQPNQTKNINSKLC